MANFENNKIISTVGGDDNGNFDWELPEMGTYRLTIGGTWGSRTLAVGTVDRSGNFFVLPDKDGNDMTAISANTIVVVATDNLRITMAGTGTAELTCEIQQLK